MALKLYNTLTKRKETFVPLEPGKVKFYMCGPTVYDYIHIGNARAFVVFDVLRRFLQFLQYDVTYVMNLTDIDDRIIERAIRDKIDTQQVTEKYTREFFEDLKSLGVLEADIHPKATEHVDEIIALINRLMERGMAYQVNGDVYFKVKAFAEYGRLSGKKIADLQAGARIEVDEKKQSPMDFALWKSQKPGEPAWDSPWGKGRPGWHIECSAMSMNYLGENFDIHAGGIDLVFPHHENEIAQSEGATGKTFVRYWLHNGFLEIDGDKMAKSLGNFKTVREVTQKYSGKVIRLYFLQKHYRGPIDFTKEGLESAKSAAARLKIFYQNLKKAVGDQETSIARLDENNLNNEEKDFVNAIKNLQSELVSAMEDDLNTPAALSAFFDMVRESNKLLSKESFTDSEQQILIWLQSEFDQLDTIFGIIDKNEQTQDLGLIEELIQLLLDIRKELREEKIWNLADKIRDELNNKGVVLEDKNDRTSWRFK
ncbi:MAG: cysteine--tRNA ligase [bacterium]